jgi:cytidyltransferase-like protein
MSKVVLVTGGFDPLHSGHIEYFEAAKELGNKLVVGVNSDAWLTRKKGRPFMSFEERTNIIKHLGMVDQVIGFDDNDDSACCAIFQMLSTHGSSADIIFANGGDRNNTNSPEYKMYKYQHGLQFAWAVGGEDKKNSSSSILKEWSQPTTERAWGTYTVLDKNNGWQVKELSFFEGKALSDQRHINRSEHWHVVSGQIQMNLEFEDGRTLNNLYIAGESIDIPKNTWHKATNTGQDTATVIEVWLGNNLTENDIERRD